MKDNMTAAFLPESVQPAKSGWKSRLLEVLPLFGHRNWIVVADSAYPAHSNPGIETIVAGGDQLEVIDYVLAAISSCKHIRPDVYADKELAFVTESDAYGVVVYRRKLQAMLQGANVHYIPHDEIIQKLDISAQQFNVLLIKTGMTIPYTSVFFALECDYWSADAEQRLRKAISAAASA